MDEFGSESETTVILDEVRDVADEFLIIDFAEVLLRHAEFFENSYFVDKAYIPTPILANRIAYAYSKGGLTDEEKADLIDDFFERAEWPTPEDSDKAIVRSVIEDMQKRFRFFANFRPKANWVACRIRAETVFMFASIERIMEVMDEREKQATDDSSN